MDFYVKSLLSIDMGHRRISEILDRLPSELFWSLTSVSHLYPVPSNCHKFYIPEIWNFNNKKRDRLWLNLNQSNDTMDMHLLVTRGSCKLLRVLGELAVGWWPSFRFGRPHRATSESWVDHFLAGRHRTHYLVLLFKWVLFLEDRVVLL